MLCHWDRCVICCKAGVLRIDASHPLLPVRWTGLDAVTNASPPCAVVTLSLQLCALFLPDFMDISSLPTGALVPSCRATFHDVSLLLRNHHPRFGAWQAHSQFSNGCPSSSNGSQLQQNSDTLHHHLSRFTVW
ncbi:hypothetical protein BU25DRAFT_112103 [Macroventuria anomochaeta]|uniref:Uncharacterized protein n=1 Tax=Macroventuria anomochaeta TaxID=301207 RepID=A0ACB6RU03_9PLEO|nr:uncharacterized protein BU25DRAFT_112103 [Macroventuria anomochaeta]KAF2625421.1 hypothetical protein BU25DRAFT_112103 [Macroventuria anomochaeta]